MSIVKLRDPRSGITYAYESKAIWDKEKKQARPKRTLIGRVDPETGEIVPTDGRCRKRSPNYDPANDPLSNMATPRTLAEYKAAYKEMRDIISKLESEIAALKEASGNHDTTD